MKLLLGLEFIFIVAIWIFYTNKLSTLLRKEGFGIRGVLKHFTYHKISESTRKITRLWLILTVIWSISIWIFFSSFFLDSDLGFLIGLFPFVWYYFVLRYFIWTKEDLMEQPPEQKSTSTEHIETIHVSKNNEKDHAE